MRAPPLVLEPSRPPLLWASGLRHISTTGPPTSLGRGSSATFKTPLSDHQGARCFRAASCAAFRPLGHPPLQGGVSINLGPPGHPPLWGGGLQWFFGPLGPPPLLDHGPLAPFGFGSTPLSNQPPPPPPNLAAGALPLSDHYCPLPLWGGGLRRFRTTGAFSALGWAPPPLSDNRPCHLFLTILAAGDSGRCLESGGGPDPRTSFVGGVPKLQRPVPQRGGGPDDPKASEGYVLGGPRLKAAVAPGFRMRQRPLPQSGGARGRPRAAEARALKRRTPGWSE